MSPEQFKTKLLEENIPVSDEKLEQFHKYLKLLQEWNQKINLTTIVEDEEVYLKHFFDSLTLAFYVNFEDREFTLCDVGSGAGFPSIPLKIIYPNIQITIVDSLKKRIGFLEKVVEELELDGVYLYHDRAETFGQDKKFRNQFDFTTARAVANMSVLTEFCMPLTKKNGTFIAMKAQTAEEELVQAGKAIATLGGKIRENIHFELPEGAGDRHIILIDKKKETPNKYPRKPGTPAKKPL